MGLNRRKFTREFKEAAVRRLELGALVAEVSVPAKSMRMSCIAGGASCGSLAPRRLADRAGVASMKIASLRWNEKWQQAVEIHVSG